MIQELAFMSHQLGSFLDAYGGGLIYDTLGSYTMAWRIGLAAGIIGSRSRWCVGTRQLIREPAF
jgi:hypothetical protein